MPGIARVTLLVMILLSSAAGARRAVGQTTDHEVDTASYAGAPAGATSASDEKVTMIRELMRRRGGDPAATAQLIQLTRECSPATAAGLFDDLAAAHQKAGNLTLAAETRQLFVERFPDEPAAAQATLWLVRLYSSSEVSRAHRRAESAPTLGTGVLVPHNAPLGAPAANGAPTEKRGQISQASASSKSLNDSATYALFLASKVTNGHAALGQDAALKFQLAVAARLAGNAKLSNGWLTSLKHSRAGDPWADAARIETWLVDAPDDPPPKPAAHCKAASLPNLDGELGDDCWQAIAFGLSDSGEKSKLHASPVEVHFAYNDDYLFLSVRCAKVSGCDYTSDDSPRSHDGDVQRHDRVRILLDLDRDYATCFELVVDSRGWTADRCWDDAAWNPEWFVAAKSDAACWTAEAAIPLAELTASPPQPGDAWACHVERRAPGAGSQAWPAPAAKRLSPEQFGLLLFDAGT